MSARKAVLAHGAFHGAWCWRRFEPELSQRGVEPVSVDLPVQDVELGAAAYAEIVLAASAGFEAGDLVIGHSMSGQVLPLVATARPDLTYIYIGAFLPCVGKSADDQFATEPLLQWGSEANPNVTSSPGPYRLDELGRLVVADRKAAAELFYNGCTPEIAEWAATQLLPQARKVSSEVTPLTRWPATNNTYVVCREDRSINPDWSRKVVPERLGVEPLEISGGHSPYLSRPAELADLILGGCPT